MYSPEVSVSLEARLIRWIEDSGQRGMMPAGHSIISKAEDIAKEIKFADHSFTWGWLNRFIKRLKRATTEQPRVCGVPRG